MPHLDPINLIEQHRDSHAAMAAEIVRWKDSHARLLKMCKRVERFHELICTCMCEKGEEHVATCCLINLREYISEAEQQT